MANREFILNRNISDSNSLIDLVQSTDPGYNEEVNVIEHSLYYSDDDFKGVIESKKSPLRILNLNCCGLNAKFDKLNLFLANMNTDCPFSVITLQETHISADSDVNLFHIPDYSLVYDPARINSFGGVAIYVHNSFSFNRLGNDDFKQNSNVFEGIFLEIFSNCQKQKKYVIGSIYRRPSDLVVLRYFSIYRRIYYCIK